MLISPEEYLKGKRKEHIKSSFLTSPQEYLSRKEEKPTGLPRLHQPSKPTPSESRSPSATPAPVVAPAPSVTPSNVVTPTVVGPYEKDGVLYDANQQPIAKPPLIQRILGGFDRSQYPEYAAVRQMNIDKAERNLPVLGTYVRAMEALLDTAPGKFVDRISQKAAYYSIPDAPMFGTREDGTQGILEGTSARELYAERNPIESTGNETQDKVADTIGMLGSYFLNPAAPAQGPVGLFRASQNIGATSLGRLAGNRSVDQVLSGAVRSPMGQRALREAAREGAVGAAYGVPSALIRGDTSPGEIAATVGAEGLLGAAGGSIFGAASEAIGRTLRSRKIGKELRDLIESAELGRPHEHPPERIVQDYLAPHDRNRLAKKAQYKKEYERALEGHYNALKEFVKKPAGVEQGYSPMWYRDWMRENNYRQPNQKELRELAEEHMRNGFQDVTMEAPPWRPNEILEIDFEIERARDMMRETQNPEAIAALQRTTDLLEEGKKELLEYLPFEVDSAFMPAQATVRPARATTQKTQSVQQPPIMADGRPTLKRIERPRSEVDAINKKTTPKTVVKRSEIIRELSEKLELPIRVGRFRQRAHGIFKVKPEVVRTKLAGDVPTISHEIGHALDKRFQLATRSFDDELLRIGKVTSGPDYSTDQIRKEGVAEFFRLMLTEPQTAKSVAPKFYRHYMEKVPLETRKILMDAQGKITAYRGQTIYQRSFSELSIGKGKRKKLPTAEELYTMFVEEYYPIQKRLKPMGEVGQKVFEGFRLLRGSAGKSRAFLTVGRMDSNYKKIGKGMDEILKPVKKNLNEFRTYLKDKRAIQLAERNIMTGSDVTTQERMINILDLEQRFPNFPKAQKELLEYQDSLLNELVKGDVIAPEDVARFKRLNEDYVPFYRDFEDDVVRGGSGDQPIKHIKGSDREIVDPLESIVKNTYHYIAIAERNKSKLNLVDAVTKAEGLGGLVERIPPPMKATQFTLDELMKVLQKTQDKDSLLSVAEMEMEAIASIFRPNYKIAGKNNIIQVFRGGKPELYELDPMLFEAVNRANQEQLNLITRVFALPTRILRAGVVNTAEFWFKNLFRDQFEAAIKSKTGYIPFLDLIRGMYHVMGKTDLYNKFLHSGGAISFRQSLDRDYLQHDLRRILAASVKDKAMNVITNPIGAMQALSEFSETATRMGVFRKAVKKGESVRDAGLIARDVMDFSRKGTVGKHINMMSAFWNAQVQGIDKTIRMFTDKKTAPRAFAATMSYITVPTIGMYLNVRNDPRYQELPQWDKDLFWHFWVGDKHFRMPIPFELGIIFKVVPERLMSMALEQDKNAFDQFGERLWDEFVPIPWFDDISLIAPWYEAASNKSFTGAPIVPRSQEGLLPQDQAGPYTSSLAKAVANLPGVSSNYLADETLGSPRKVDHIIRGYTGSLGQYATQLIDAGLKAVGMLEQPSKPKTGLETWPFFKGFMGRTLSGNTHSVENFYKKLNQLEREYNSAQRKDQPYEHLGELKFLKKLQGVMSELSRIYREIESSDMSPEEKRDELRIINTEINNLARMGLGKDRLEVEDFFPSILRRRRR